MNILSALLLIPFIAAQPTDNPLQQPLHLTNTTLAGGAFSYTGVTGPLGWTGLDPSNAQCSISRRQSPINLDNGIGSPARSPSVWIPDGYVDLTNNGHTVQATARGTTVLSGRTYSLLQYHFHTPSEHRVFDEYYPLEVHFVHQAQDGSLLVLGAFFEVTANGATTPFVSALARQLHLISTPGSVTRVNGLSAGPLINLWQNGRLFGYTGSLTTPPCSDGVLWLVAQDPLPIDVTSYLAFKKIMKFNARYTQNRPGQTNLIEVAASQMPRWM